MAATWSGTYSFAISRFSWVWPRSSGSVWNLSVVSRHRDAFNIIPFPSDVVLEVQVLFQQRRVTCWTSGRW